MKRGRLWGMRAYLCGPMDKAQDGGIGWRRVAASWLEARGCTPFDPTDKPIALGAESEDDRARRHQLLADGRLDELAAEIKLLRCVDLRMVDITDFTIVYLDMNSKPCGTFEELFLANREMKPVLIVGPDYVPLWIYGTVPHQHIFRSWDALYEYLEHVDQGDGQGLDRLKRWYFFDQERVHRVTVQQTARAIINDLLLNEQDPALAEIGYEGDLYVKLDDLAERFGLNLREIKDALHPAG